VIVVLKMEHPMGKDAAVCLNLHAAYLCRHEGACCRAGWAIPVERPVYERLSVHFGRASRRPPLFEDDGPLPEGAAAILGVQQSGACVFFEADRGNLCGVHRELGAEWLPAACRQFPRVVLHDARGTLISLSHFCPTAAGLLHSLQASAFDVVNAPRTVALDGEVEGLDAREALPPLLRPGLLTDHEGYDAWERRAIGVFARGDLTAEQALGRVGAATRAVQSWRPGAVSLRETVDREFAVASAGKPDKDLDGIAARVRLALGSVPEGLSTPPRVEGFAEGWQHVSPWWGEYDGAIRGYLAARLFGNWVAYYGQGLHAIVEYLQVALAVVKMEAVRHHASEAPTSTWQTVNEAIRSADLLLVHLADTKLLSRRLG
jgi:Fe-S-cluster containining protein